MKSEDGWLFGVIFAIWGALSLMYYTIPMIYMPTNARVWGLGALLFLILTILIGIAESLGRKKGSGGG